MSKLLRYFEIGNQYFITAVTHKRQPILTDSSAIILKCLSKMLKKHRTKLIAWVVLPDHIHILINPQGHVDSFMHDFKLSFGAYFRKENGMSSGRIWQARYWDHIIRNQDDLNNHIDYIHFNPVSHGFVDSPFDWKDSSIHDYSKKGYYEGGWGVKKELSFSGSFGE